MNDSALKSNAPSITARPTSQEKRSFAEVAAKLQVSESALALIAIRTLLASDVPDLPARTSSSEPATDRITIRLRPGDRLAIRRRAGERRMKDSAYMTALVRGHVAANPPLVSQELTALKAAVSVLAGFGRLFARTAREAAQAGVLPRDLQQDLSRTRALVADVERRMHEFAQAALVSWESRVDAAHFAYISRRGSLEIEADEGERIGREEQKRLLDDWHLELTAGHRRAGPRN